MKKIVVSNVRIKRQSYIFFSPFFWRISNQPNFGWNGSVVSENHNEMWKRLWTDVRHQMMNKAHAMVNTLLDTKWWRKFKLCKHCVIPQIINKVPSMWGKKIYQGEFKSIRNVNHSLNVNHSNNVNILIQQITDIKYNLCFTFTFYLIIKKMYNNFQISDLVNLYLYWLIILFPFFRISVTF